MSQKRESQYVRFARLADAVAQASVPRYAHPKSPQRFTQPQLVACLLLTQYLNLSCRNTEEWLLASAEVREVLQLTEVPDHTTISRMLKRLTLARLGKCPSYRPRHPFSCASQTAHGSLWQTEKRQAGLVAAGRRRL